MKKLLALVLLCVSTFASAALTTDQYALLRADIQADVSLAAAVQAGDYGTITAAYNLTGLSGQCWKSSYTLAAYMKIFDANAFIPRSQAERDALRFMFSAGPVDTRQAAVRSGYDNIYSGTTALAIAARSAFATDIQRACTRAERLFATGTGPYVTTFEGALPFTDVRFALVGY